MTREEAIAYGRRAIDLGLNDETQDFFETAIKALEQEPCEDAISREAVLDEIEELKQSPWFNDDTHEAKIIRKEAVEIVEYLCVKKLPSVNPQGQKFIAKSDGTIEQINNCDDCVFKKEWGKIGEMVSAILKKQIDQEPKTGRWIYGEDNPGTGRDGWFCNTKEGSGN